MSTEIKRNVLSSQDIFATLSVSAKTLLETIKAGKWKNTYTFTGFDINVFKAKLVEELKDDVKRTALMYAVMLLAINPGKVHGKRLNRLVGKNEMNTIATQLNVAEDASKAAANQWTMSRLGAVLHPLIIMIKMDVDLAKEITLAPAAGVTYEGHPNDYIWNSQEGAYMFPKGIDLADQLFALWLLWAEKHHKKVQSNRATPVAFNKDIQHQKRQTSMVQPALIVISLKSWKAHFDKTVPDIAKLSVPTEKDVADAMDWTLAPAAVVAPAGAAGAGLMKL